MDKGRLILVSTITAVLIIIYLASTLDIFREEDKSESEYMQAFGNMANFLKAFGNVFSVILVIYEIFW